MRRAPTREGDVVAANEQVVEDRAAALAEQPQRAVMRQDVVGAAQHGFAIQNHRHGIAAHGHHQGVVRARQDRCASRQVRGPNPVCPVTQHHLVRAGDHPREEEVVGRGVGEGQTRGGAVGLGVHLRGVFDVGQRRHGQRPHADGRVVRRRRGGVNARRAAGRRPGPGLRCEVVRHTVREVLHNRIGEGHRQFLQRITGERCQRLVRRKPQTAQIERRGERVRQREGPVGQRRPGGVIREQDRIELVQSKPFDSQNRQIVPAGIAPLSDFDLAVQHIDAGILEVRRALVIEHDIAVLQRAARADFQGRRHLVI